MFASLKIKRLVATAAIMCGLSLASSASATTLDFYGSGAVGSKTIDILFGDLTVNVEGSRKLRINHTGIGLQNPPKTNKNTIQPGQTVTLTFAREVTLISAILAEHGQKTEYGQVSLVGGPSVNFALDGAGTSSHFVDFSGTTGFTGTSFVFGSLASGDNKPGFRIDSIVVATPLPASGVLILAALGGLAVMRRRSHAKAA